MGDWFEVIADIEATAEKAAGLAAEVLAWLIERGIVMAEQTDCVLGDSGHAPGPNYADAVTEPDPDLYRLRTNGLEVFTGQTVFYSMGVDRIVCPHCEAAVVDRNDEGSWERFSTAIDTWYSGGTGTRACEYCGRPVDLNDWHWSPPWAFGYLGFKFWNWPMLDQTFVAEVSRRLGHRTVRPSGKI